MPYGSRKDKTLERRMVDLGRSKASSDLLRLRSVCIDATNTLAQCIWPPSILDDMPPGKQLDKAMLATQSAMRGTLNSVWAEKCRINAKTAVTEQVKRAQRKLFGKFKHLASVGDKPLKNGTRRLLNFPKDWSDKLSDQDIASLAKLAKDMSFIGTLELFRKIEKRQVTSLSQLQADALGAMLDHIKQRYGIPVWDASDSKIQLHLDFRCIVGVRSAQNALLDGLTQAVEIATTRDNKPTPIAFSISGVVAHGTSVPLAATFRANTVKTLGTDKNRDVRFTSLAIEIGPKDTVIRGVLTHKPKPYGIEEAKHVLGDDFGYCNTSAQALVKIDAPLTADFFKQAADWTKAQAKAYLESHTHHGEPITTTLHDGRDFLAKINIHAERIDAIRSEIDRVYNRFHRIKHEVCQILEVNGGTRLDFAMDAGNDKRLAKLLGKARYLLVHVSNLKALRRTLYRTIGGIKKCWFGWLGNRQVEFARQQKAVVVREDLTLVAKEKEKPGYLGRTFNRMLNNGAKGQYLRAASSKLKWHGIPEMKVPSFYTSSTDVRFGIVDKKQRKSQDQFVAQRDGKTWHADVHAALTLALYALLKPIESRVEISAT